MTAIHWLNDISGSFTNAADWSGGAVPGASDDAILDAAGSAFTVISGVNETVESAQLASNATLSLTSGRFNAVAGTGSGANAGVILVGAGATFEASGTMTNTGTIALYGSGPKPGAWLMFTGSTTLTGGGVVRLEGQGHDMIRCFRESREAVLYNVDNTIVGSGTIAAKILIVNEEGGTIDASGASPLIVYGAIGNNAGLVEATGPGGLIFENATATMDSSITGVVLAGAGSEVELVRTPLIGGTLEATGSGKFIVEDAYLAGGIVEGDVSPLIIDTNVTIIGGCNFGGTIENNGTISGGNIGGGTVTWEGNGDVDLGGRRMDFSALTLASGTISGKGVIVGEKSYPFSLTIAAAGVIDGNTKHRLLLDTFTSIVNGGLIESTGAGEVLIRGAIVNTGTLSVDRGTFEVTGAVTGKGVAIVGGGSLEFLSTFDEAVRFGRSGGILELANSQGFTNMVSGFSTTGKTTLDLGDIGFVGAGEATFSGTATSGVLTVTDGTHTAHITLVGDYLASTFVASSDGHGGTLVATQKAAAAPPHAFVAAMAGLGGSAGSALPAGEGWPVREPMLAAPRAMTA